VSADLIEAIRHGALALREDADRQEFDEFGHEKYAQEARAKAALLMALIDPENQPNQFGVVIPGVTP
jgi:hypothetical protein